MVPLMPGMSLLLKRLRIKNNLIGHSSPPLLVTLVSVIGFVAIVFHFLKIWKSQMIRQRSQTSYVLAATVALGVSYSGGNKFGRDTGLAFGSELLLPGGLAKIAAGAGQTVSRGGSALFYNPANTIYSKFVEANLDLSYGSATYTYQHTDVATFDPVTVGKSLPFVTAGLSLRVIPELTVAAAILPTGLGSAEVATGVPVSVGGQTLQGDGITSHSGMKLAVGAAFKLDYPLIVGAGLIRTSATNTLQVFPPGSAGTTPDDSAVDAEFGGSWNQFIVGVRSELMNRRLVLAGSFKTGVQQVYDSSSDVLINGFADSSADFVAYEGIDYLPGAIGLGVELRMGDFGGFFDYERGLWSSGSTLVRSFLPGSAEVTELLDTNNFVGGIKYWMGKDHMVVAAGGLQGGNRGIGYLPTEDEEPELRVLGMQFGVISGVPRWVFSGGYRYRLAGHGSLQVGGIYGMGELIIPEGYDAEGLHSLNFFAVTGAVSYGL